MAKIVPGKIASERGLYTATLRAAAAATTTYVASDYIELTQGINQISLLISFTKGTSGVARGVLVRPEYSNNGDAASPNWFVPVSAGSTTTSGSLTTVTVNRTVYLYTHSSTTAGDIDYIVEELPINCNFFRVSVALDAADAANSVTIVAFLART